MKSPILVWQFYDSPKVFQELSPHGGDEDWLAFVPNDQGYDYIPWLESGSRFGVCDISEHEVEGGKIFIGAHA
jgi:hypothetical protein